MAVPAHPAKVPTTAANLGLVDMRAGAPVPAGTFTYDSVDLVTGWHTHDLHQIEYAFAGIAEVETTDARYLLPPHQAMWIPAGCEHSTTLHQVRSIAVFFAPAMLADLDGRARVVAAPPVLREMLVYATRWPITRERDDPAAAAFFAALAVVTRDCLGRESPLALPTSADPIVSGVMARTRADLVAATAGSVARAVGISERTLRRRFLADTGMTWSSYLHASRIMRAMALLAEPHRSITAVALDVGFDDVGSFTRAFRRATGETPTRYRRRIR